MMKNIYGYNIKGEFNTDRYEYVKTDKNGTEYYADWKCDRCGGHGFIQYYAHVEGGVCFECGGSGRRTNPRIIKVYTEEYAEVLTNRRKARDEKRRAEEIAHADEKNAEFFERFGFDADGNTYAILGNTYEIKEELKNKGAKYDSIIGWHLPYNDSNYNTIQIHVSEMYGTDYANRYSYSLWDMADSNALKEKIENARLDYVRTNDTTTYVGEVGERVELNVTLDHIATFETNYTYYGELNFIYNFIDENGNTLVWKTTKCIDKAINDKMILKGTVKDHSEYRGIKQTVLTRCKIA